MVLAGILMAAAGTSRSSAAEVKIGMLAPLTGSRTAASGRNGAARQTLETSVGQGLLGDKIPLQV
jgi:hypothetical protein